MNIVTSRFHANGFVDAPAPTPTLKHDDQAQQQQLGNVEQLLRRPIRRDLDTGDFEVEVDLLALRGATEGDVVDDDLAVLDEELDTGLEQPVLTLTLFKSAASDQIGTT